MHLKQELQTLPSLRLPFCFLFFYSKKQRIGKVPQQGLAFQIQMRYFLNLSEEVPKMQRLCHQSNFLYNPKTSRLKRFYLSFQIVRLNGLPMEFQIQYTVQLMKLNHKQQCEYKLYNQLYYIPIKAKY